MTEEKITGVCLDIPTVIAEAKERAKPFVRFCEPISVDEALADLTNEAARSGGLNNVHARLLYMKIWNELMSLRRIKSAFDAVMSELSTKEK